MITKLRAQNFKSWKDTGDLHLVPLTGLFGTNSSGKTSILQMLLMLKQTVESPDRNSVLHFGDERSLVDLGTFYDVLYAHQTDAPLQLDLSWKLPETLRITDPEAPRRDLYSTDVLAFHTEIHEEDNLILVERFRYTFDTHEFGMQREDTNKKKGRNQYNLITGDYSAKRTRGRVWQLPPPVKCYGFPDEASGYYQNTGFLSDFVLAFENLFSRITYLGPLREYPHRSYIWAGERPQDVGQRGEKAIAALLAARAEGLTSPRLVNKIRRRKPIEERILDWLREMELIHSFSLQPIAENRKDYEFRVKKNRTSSEVLITDVGFGVSQLLPVLVLCYYAPEHSTIILEQPEIHLHPSVQAGLADVFIDVVNERNVQIILESHSEHLLRRLQRRIAEEQISADDTALYFCRIDDGLSKIEKLNVDLFGSITNWPQGFFGDEMGELAAMTTAAMKRRKESGL
jgi:predicted ATPase